MTTCLHFWKTNTCQTPTNVSYKLKMHTIYGVIKCVLKYNEPRLWKREALSCQHTVVNRLSHKTVAPCLLQRIISVTTIIRSKS